MLADLNMLLDNPLLLLLVLLAGALVGIVVEQGITRIDREKRQAYWRGRKDGSGKASKIVSIKGGQPQAIDLAAEQLKTVMQASFTATPVLNKPERRLLACIDKALEELSPGWRAMAQVSLGEVLRSKDKDAFLAINSKRVDLLVIDADCNPLQVIEFQGTGHHLGPEAVARDAVKKEALRKAGIGYIEVVSGDTPAEMREMVRKWVNRHVAAGDPQVRHR